MIILRSFVIVKSVIGAVAHLVEHYNGIVEVVGSSPISSKISIYQFLFRTKNC